VECPYGEELMSRNVQVQMVPSFSEEDVEDIIQAIRKVAIHYRR
jgi:dTDP-4-amino-4,6-dideoxygalactose transaminase